MIDTKPRCSIQIFNPTTQKAVRIMKRKIDIVTTSSWGGRGLALGVGVVVVVVRF
jgi:hypothetical protein